MNRQAQEVEAIAKFFNLLSPYISIRLMVWTIWMGRADDVIDISSGIGGIPGAHQGFGVRCVRTPKDGTTAAFRFAAAMAGAWLVCGRLQCFTMSNRLSSFCETCALETADFSVWWNHPGRTIRCGHLFGCRGSIPLFVPYPEWSRPHRW